MIEINNKIKERIFIVGCERSGTTLLQCMLSANSSIYSFPESHFFANLYEESKWRLFLGLASHNARRHWKQFLKDINHPEKSSALPWYAITNHKYTGTFIQVLDQLTIIDHKNNWLEKTPEHLHFINRITQEIQGAKFIHIIRNGQDNIASLYDIGIKYKHIWKQEYESIDECINRWVEDVRISLQYTNESNHYLVMYDQLVDDPKAIIMKACEFIGIIYEEKMVKDYQCSASGIILEKEEWKKNLFQPIYQTHNSKFYSLFNEKQRDFIQTRLEAEFPKVIYHQDLY